MSPRPRAWLGIGALALLGCHAPTPDPPTTTDAGADAGPWEPGCRHDDPATLRGCVRADRYEALLRRVVGPRPPRSPHWREVQRLCDVTLASHGFDVEHHVYGTGTNIVGTRAGARWPEQHVVIGAHYDHIPGCPGADDNASGVAGILEMARVLSGVDFPRTLVVACWDEEERGLVGSRAWAARARARELDIDVYFNFDAIAFTDPRPGTQRIPAGFGLLFPDQIAALARRDDRADFIAVVSDAAALPHARRLAAAAAAEQLPVALLAIPTLVLRSHVAVDLQRSDHAALWDQGYPAVMITDTAEYRSDAYHCRGRADGLDSLDLPFATRVVRSTTEAVAAALRAPPRDAGPSALRR